MTTVAMNKIQSIENGCSFFSVNLYFLFLFDKYYTCIIIHWSIQILVSITNVDLLKLLAGKIKNIFGNNY